MEKTTKIIRWAVIGAGGIADRRMIPALLSDPNNRLVAVMDKNAEVAEKIAKKYSVNAWYSDEETMLSEIECDAVYIGTPVFCHYKQAMTALKYGANVFMEKPIAMNAKEGAALVKAFKKKGKQLTIGYMMPLHNLHVKTKNLVKRGKLGQVNNVRAQFSCWYPDIPGSWRQKKSLGGGGCVMDLAVHCIDLIQNVLGEKIVEVKSFLATNTFSYEVEDSGLLAFRTESGCLGHIDVNFNIPDDCSVSRLELYGTKGSVYAEGTLGQEEIGKLRYIYAPQGDYDAAQSRVKAKATTYYGAKGNLYLKQAQAFCSLLKSGKTDYTLAENAVYIQGLCDKIYKGN